MTQLTIDICRQFFEAIATMTAPGGRGEAKGMRICMSLRLYKQINVILVNNILLILQLACFFFCIMLVYGRQLRQDAARIKSMSK